MMKYKLQIRTLSSTLIGSGFGSTLIDTDTEFHASGFPMIRARTIKGLLRESAQDILEITGENVSLDDLFGISDRGELNTQLRISNAYIQNWDKIKNELTHFNAYTEKIKEYLLEK